MLDKALSLILW